MSAPEPEDKRPQWLRELKPLKPQRRQPGPAPTVRVEATGYAARAFDEEVARMAAAVQGTRNDTLNVAAYNLGQLVGANLLDYMAVWNALHATALHTGLPSAEVTGTLRSGLEAGIREPRQVPELVRDGQAAPEPTVLVPVADAQDTADPDPLAAVIERLSPLDWAELWADDTTEEWLLEPLLPARRLVALFSAPKVGKSLFLLDLAVAIATGKAFLGQPAQEPRVVLYVDFENDPRGDVRTRLQAMGYGPDDLANLRYLSYPQLAKLDTAMGGLELLTVARHHGAALVVIDTISRAVSGEENDNDTWLAFYRNTGQHLKAAGIACIRLDHTGKDETKGMRGGSAKYGDVDVVWSMTLTGEDVLRLECTANRLPITEKRLVIERQHTPLRHEIDTRGMAGVHADLVPGVVALLDQAGVPPSDGQNKAYDALKEAGLLSPHTPRQVVRLAQVERQRRASQDQQIDGTDPRIKD